LKIPCKQEKFREDRGGIPQEITKRSRRERPKLPWSCPSYRLSESGIDLDTNEQGKHNQRILYSKSLVVGPDMSGIGVGHVR
jgi:hypothetical protein